MPITFFVAAQPVSVVENTSAAIGPEKGVLQGY